MGNWISNNQEQDRFPLMRRKTRRYGWNPDILDNRDIMANFPIGMNIKPSIDLREFMPPVYDQGELGSSAANAIVGAFEFDQKKQNRERFTPSRMFVYFNSRVIAGTIDYDSGASIRDGIKVINRLGVCNEELHSYQIDNFALQPSPEAYIDADKHKSINYRRIRISIDDITKALGTGFPVIFGFTVYESFESQDLAKSGMMPMPKPGEKIVGGHAVMAVGYNNDLKLLFIRNSWGPQWGRAGYFCMPYDYFTPRYCGDAWMIKTTIQRSVVKVEQPSLSQPAGPVEQTASNNSKPTYSEVVENKVSIKKQDPTEQSKIEYDFKDNDDDNEEIIPDIDDN